MDLYDTMFASTLACCSRAALRHAPVYTLSMLVLGAVICLSLLSVLSLLRMLGVIENPGSPRTLLGLLYCAFLVNLILARLRFRADLRAMLRARVPADAGVS